MTSHEYAVKLLEVVRLLQTSAEFEMPVYTKTYVENHGIDHIRYYADKELFLKAVRAVGSGKKIAGEDDSFTFAAADGLLRLSVNRDAVCRLVKPAVPAEYECEPLLSQAEEAEISA